jgi:hypothetical protein
VRVLVHRLQHGEPLGGHLQTVVAEGVGVSTGHDPTMDPSLDCVKNQIDGKI